MATDVRRRPEVKRVRSWRAALSALLVLFLGVGGTLVSLSAEAADGPATLQAATLVWGFNEELNTGAFDGSCNHLSAGRTDGSQAAYRGVDGDVTVEKRTASGAYSTISDWAARCNDANGTKVTVGGTARLGLRIRLTGGDGTHDRSTGATTIRWVGSFSANLYDELVPLWFIDPTLVIDGAGNATLSADLGGYASSLENPDVRVEVPVLPDVVIARFSGVTSAGAAGFTSTPLYAGVPYENVEAPQVRNTANWGSWPGAMVDAMARTGTSGYWYSTGGGADARKAPSPVTVDFGPQVLPTTTTTTTTSQPTSSSSVPPSSTSSTTTSSTTTTSTTTSTSTTSTSTTSTSTSTSTTSTSTTSSTTTSTPTTTSSTSVPTSTTTPPVTTTPTSVVEQAATTTTLPPTVAGSSSTKATDPSNGAATRSTATRRSRSASGLASTGSTAGTVDSQDTPSVLASVDDAVAAAPAPAAATPSEPTVREVGAALRYADMSTAYQPSWNPAAPGRVEITYTVENTGDVTLAARGSARVATSVGPAAGGVSASLEPLAPGRRRTQTQVVDGVWPGFDTETVLRLEPYVPAQPDLDLAAATITARSSSTVWPWQQLLLIAVLAALAAGGAAWLWQRSRNASTDAGSAPPPSA